MRRSEPLSADAGKWVRSFMPEGNMKDDVQFAKALSCVEICAAGAGVPALLSLVSWVLGEWRIGALGSGFIPMAPSTACLLILLSCGILVHRRWPTKPTTRWFAFFAVFIAAAASLLLGAQYVFGFELPLERWLAPTTATVSGIRVGRMSPLTAAVFLLTTLAFLSQLPPLGRQWLCRQIGAAHPWPPCWAARLWRRAMGRMCRCCTAIASFPWHCRQRCRLSCSVAAS